MKLKVAWISAGVSSFIATYLVRDTVDLFYYIDIADQHPDSLRFIQDCEKALGKHIEILSSDEYKNVDEACRAGGCIRMVTTNFAPCTSYLKQRVRKEKFEMLHLNDDITYVWGFDCSQRERQRTERLYDSMPNFKHEFPLIDKNLTKQDCHAILKRLGIKRPKMYDLGYENNNCIGCVKGGMGYWNKIRIDFPDIFKARAKMERDLGCRCLKECYLDELDPMRGNVADEIMEDCGIFCELALQNND